MYETDTINLLRAKIGISPKLTAIGKELRRVSIILTSIVVGVGLLTSVAYIVLNRNFKEHERVKNQMIDAIRSETKKEGLYVSVQDRLRAIEQILAQAYPWDSALNAILGLGTIDQFKSLAIDDQGQVSIRMDSPTFEDARSVIEKIVTHIIEKDITVPRLATLQLDEEGKIHMALSFQFKPKQ